MDIIIDKPENIKSDILGQILLLVEEGSQISASSRTLRSRLLAAELIGFIIDKNVVLTTATLKNPSKNYKRNVFKEAKVSSLDIIYNKELGYIATRSSREGEKLCQILLQEFIPKINTQKIFATSRKASIIHILKKFGFKQIGEKYKTDLSLIIN
jgi:predicted GNAT family N-acyltransferase